MNALLAGLIGVAATLLGSFTTYLFQSRTAERAQSFERDERLRYEQLNACSAFASALTELKRGLITLWFRRGEDAQGADYLAARIEGDRLGASAEAAQFRVQLVLGDPELVMLADAAFTAVGAISSSPDRNELRERENHFEAAVTAFIRAAAERLRTTALSSAPGRPGQDAPAPLRSLTPPMSRVPVTYCLRVRQGAAHIAAVRRGRLPLCQGLDQEWVQILSSGSPLICAELAR